MKQRLALLLAALLLLCGCAPAVQPEESTAPPQTETTVPPTETEPTEPSETQPPETLPPYVSDYDGSLGSAGSLKGTTILVSIFASDASTSWDETADAALMEKSLQHLTVAAEWLTQKAAAFRTEASFVYDWSQESDLRYSAAFDEDLVVFNSGKYAKQEAFIQENIDADALKEKYRADNLVYLFFFNTAYTSDVRPWSLGYTTNEDYLTEFTNLYLKFGGYDAPPATYAHEILHAFGAHDLYYAGNGISQSFVNYCTKIESNDIMYTVNAGDTITNEFSKLDAYYTGIGERPVEIGQWDLIFSEHEEYSR